MKNIIWAWLKRALGWIPGLDNRTSCEPVTLIRVESSWTGVNNLKDPQLLIKVQDTVWNDPRWKPTSNPDGSETTHCNQASLAVANGVGCHAFDAPSGGEPYTADQLYNYFQRKDTPFLEKDLIDVQELANAGSLIYAVLSSWMMGQTHGHIVSITPGEMVYSGSLKKHVPVCLNIGTAKYSARLIGLNFAFNMQKFNPRFFAWKDSL